MTKIFKWLTESNRMKHLMAGALVTFATVCFALVMYRDFLNDALYAFWTTLVAAMSVEYKDHLWGGRFDVLDILATILPALVLLVVAVIIAIV